jgi:peptide/nickel transport system permease protein
VVAIRAKLGLDRPIVQQFVIWIGNVLRGDFGESFFFKKTVAQLIAERLEPTLALAVCTLVLAVTMAVPLGVLAAWRRGTWVDRAVMGFSVLGFGGFVERLILPSVTLAIIFVALIARITRASVLEVLDADYVRTARAKGLGDLAVLLRHVLRNAAVPIVTVIGLGIAVLIGGVVVTESVYSIPGLGRLTVDAVLARDYPTVQAVILLFSVVYVLINLVVDLSYTFLDPRIRY